MVTERRQCEGPCGQKRQLQFFGPDARRKDGLSTKCNRCKRKRRTVTSRDQRLQETYGITEADYQRLLAAQGGRCAICKGKRPGNLDVDHDHALEREGRPMRECVRGLLCRRCNRRLLPAATDSIAVLNEAITYLIQAPAQDVLDAADKGLLL